MLDVAFLKYMGICRKGHGANPRVRSVAFVRFNPLKYVAFATEVDAARCAHFFGLKGNEVDVEAVHIGHVEVPLVKMRDLDKGSSVDLRLQ